jgi:hypothetical protein
VVAVALQAKIFPELKQKKNDNTNKKTKELEKILFSKKVDNKKPYMYSTIKISHLFSLNPGISKKSFRAKNLFLWENLKK